MRGMLASFVVAVALLAVVSSEASGLDLPGCWAQRDRLGSQLEHHRRQAVGAAAMRADERVARLHHPLVWLIRRSGVKFRKTRPSLIQIVSGKRATAPGP